jgi:hypothetical protein
MIITAAPQALLLPSPAWQNTTPPPTSFTSPAPTFSVSAPPRKMSETPSGIDELLNHDDVQACIRASQAEHAKASSVQLALAICVTLGLLGAGLVFADTARRLHKAKQKATQEAAACKAGDPCHSRMEHVHV